MSYVYWFLISNPEKDIDIFFSRFLGFPPTPHGYQTGKTRKPDSPFLRVNLRTLQAS